MKRLVLLASAISSLGVLALPQKGPEAERLKAFLAKERPSFEKRETKKKGLLEELDRLSRERTVLRERIDETSHLEQELQMSLDNIGQESGRVREQATVEKDSFRYFAKLAYRLRRAGILPFLVEGESVAQAGGRIRLVFRLLERQAETARLASARVVRISGSENHLAATKEKLAEASEQLARDQKALAEIDQKKRKFVSELERKQTTFREAEREYMRVAKQLANMFENLEELRDDAFEEGFRPGRQTLPIPVDNGVVARGYGKSVHHRFKTVTFHKGIEILAELGAPVRAVLPGVVEHDGWVKGLGNVVILHHGGGFYSLNAHLGKVLSARGTRVAQGDTIGTVGDTGANDKPSLYFELREHGKTVDPLPFFEPKAMARLK